KIILTILMAAIIAISIKIIGILLITGLLIIPAALARNLSSNPIQMLFIASMAGVFSIVIGLYTSLEINTSSGPSILVAASLLFIISLLPITKRVFGARIK
ncbi:MAG: metal ABC transporter permease, partial [Hyphomicrobiales bacterium]